MRPCVVVVCVFHYMSVCEIRDCLIYHRISVSPSPSPIFCVVAMYCHAFSVLRGFAKGKNNPRLLWKWVGESRTHSEFFLLENRPKIAQNQY